ncbi:MAG TPA: class I SAM-dependent rRNA methyltransferase [Blastocatellia bacterium]|nr:class I SAM-dependent rRNA methyltransferase [Blastocatellia bacterium]
MTINRHGLARVRARHCWVYRSDIVDAGDSSGGDVVQVLGPGRVMLGSALYSSRSQIALRMITFDGRTIDRDFWLNRLTDAEALRSRIAPGRDAFRLVYGESDLLPSLIIDRYQNCFVIQTLSQGMDRLKQMWIEVLVERFSPEAIIERNEAKVRDMEGLSRNAGVIYGKAPDELQITEGTLRFNVDLNKGQKTGMFLDQSENRIAAERYARGRALDCFTFQGAFALHLAKSANHVTAVDASADALQWAARNASENGLSNIEFVEANVFDLLGKMERAGERFDAIVLDPPAFAKSRGSAEAAGRGYKEINLRAIKMLSPGGTLITSTCSYHMSEDDFLNLLSQASSDAGRSVRILEKRMQAPDHPVLVSMPETYYLKCVVLSAL